jgi:hypothetical protein
VGVAGIALGVVLFATCDDPHRYDHPRPPPLTPTTLAPVAWAMPGGAGAGLTGSF